MTPYSVKTLAERWGCSEVHVRNMIARGELHPFRLGGKLIRIPHEEVARIEQCACSQSTGNTLPSGTKMANDIAARLVRTMPLSRV